MFIINFFLGNLANFDLAIASFGAISFFYPDINGAVLGVLAFAGSPAAETIVLGWRFHSQAKMAGLLFPSPFAENSSD